MSIEYTHHMVIGLGHFERFNDADLEECFSGPNKSKIPAAEIRKHIAELRAKGYEYYPCSCETVNPDGSCPGFQEDA